MLGVCVTCGVQFGGPAERCPVCEDPRQYVPVSGQQWTTLEDLRRDHRNVLRDEAGFTGIGTEPRFAIGQRALLVPWGGSNLLWDCITLLDDDTAAAVEARGGLRAIAISHPHYYSAMVEWAHRFGCPVLLHEADREWIMRPDDAIELWSGETRELGDGLTLVRCGGHFPGGTVMLAPGGRLLSGDIVQVIPDRSHVSFMYSYPNLIPLPEAEIRGILAALEPFAYERILGAWWETVIPRDGRAIVERSAQRYISAINGEMPARTG
jgi:glyoxylase-like metal-dependent hydrolase (beta-lactamase superfamily II)